MYVWMLFLQSNLYIKICIQRVVPATRSIVVPSNQHWSLNLLLILVTPYILVACRSLHGLWLSMTFFVINFMHSMCIIHWMELQAAPSIRLGVD